MSASLDAPSAIIFLFEFSSLKFRLTSAADEVIQTIIESNQSPCRDRRLSTPLPVRPTSLRLGLTPAATTAVKRPQSRPPTLLLHCLTYPRPQQPRLVNPRDKMPHAPSATSPPKLCTHTPPHHLPLWSGPPIFSDYHLHRFSPSTYITNIARNSSDNEVTHPCRRHPIGSGRDDGRDYLEW